MEKIVELSQDTLGYLLVYAKDYGDFREGDPFGAPDYFRSRAAASKVMRKINDHTATMEEKVDAVRANRMSHHMTPAQVVELREAAYDYARLVQVENFDRNDLAVQRAYERLRKSLATSQ
jgi:hypothetical protein